MGQGWFRMEWEGAGSAGVKGEYLDMNGEKPDVNPRSSRSETESSTITHTIAGTGLRLRCSSISCSLSS